MGLTTPDILFHLFAAIIFLSALLVVFVSNPVYSALFLVLSMSGLGAMFFTLEAYFIAAAQIAVYAGAVMVLFVMVIMLFDLKKSGEESIKLNPVGLAKIITTGILCGFLIGVGWLATSISPPVETTQVEQQGAEEAVVETTTVVEVEEQPTEDGVILKENVVQSEELVLSKNKADLPFGSTTRLSQILFTKWVFAFEAVGLIILLVTVGAVAVARSKGGTHYVK